MGDLVQAADEPAGAILSCDSTSDETRASAVDGVVDGCADGVCECVTGQPREGHRAGADAQPMQSRRPERLVTVDRCRDGRHSCPQPRSRGARSGVMHYRSGAREQPLVCDLAHREDILAVGCDACPAALHHSPGARLAQGLHSELAHLLRWASPTLANVRALYPLACAPLLFSASGPQAPALHGRLLGFLLLPLAGPVTVLAPPGQPRSRYGRPSYRAPRNG